MSRKYPFAGMKFVITTARGRELGTVTMPNPPKKDDLGQVIVEVGSTWWETDKRFSVDERKVIVVEVTDETVVIQRAATGRKTKAKRSRFGKSGGYRDTP